MSTTKLERMKSAPKKEAVVIDMDVHDRANKLLGYNVALKGVRASEKQHAAAEALYAACKKCKLDLPFTAASVDAYKKSKAQSAKGRAKKTMSLRWDSAEISVRWVMKKLDSSYSQQIPEFALQTACDLLEELPGLKFYVEELVVRRKPTKDPFLVAEDAAGNFHYLEVWNEPGYKQQRIA